MIGGLCLQRKSSRFGARYVEVPVSRRVAFSLFVSRNGDVLGGGYLHRDLSTVEGVTAYV
jgi:hypothetical protein